MRQNVVGRWRVGEGYQVLLGLVTARSLLLEFISFLHESLLVPVLTYGSEMIIWREMSRIRAVQMENLRCLLGIRRMDKVPNARIRLVQSD